MAPTNTPSRHKGEKLANKHLIENPTQTCSEAYIEAVMGMLAEYHWFGQFSAGMCRQETREVPIAACSWDPNTGIGTLHFNPENFQKFDLHTRIFAICHEIVHWTNLHVRSSYMGPLCNIAADMAVNSLLAKTGIKPTHPNDFITIENVWHAYAQFESGLKCPPEERAMEWYLNWLLDRRSNIQKKIKQLCQQLGLPMPGQGNQDADDLQDGIAPDLRDKLTDHEAWKEMSEEEKDLVTQYVAAQAERSSMVASPPGTMAGSLEMLIKATKPKTNWRNRLRNWTGQCGALDLKTTRSRPNKYGQPPRIVLMPTMNLEVWHDTSGSIPQNQSALFWAELESIVKTMGIELYVGQIDTVVHGFEKFKVRPQHDYSRKGCGGTDMAQIFRWRNDFKNPVNHRIKTDGLIVFTDGYTPWPTPAEIRGRRVLWVITDESMAKNLPAGIGTALYLDPSA